MSEQHANLAIGASSVSWAAEQGFFLRASFAAAVRWFFGLGPTRHVDIRSSGVPATCKQCGIQPWTVDAQLRAQPVAVLLLIQVCSAEARGCGVRGPGSSSRSRVFELQRRHSGEDARSGWRGGEDLIVRCRGRERAWIRAAGHAQKAFPCVHQS